jgi:hypothetical protein
MSRRVFRVGDRVQHDLGFTGIVEHATPDGYGGQTLEVNQDFVRHGWSVWPSWKVVLIERGAQQS